MYPSAKADGFSLLPSGSENFRPHYIRPCEDRPLPDVPRCVQIGVGLVPTRDATEGGLGSPVLLVDAPARGALARRVAGIDKADRNAEALGLIDEKTAQLAERPITEPRSCVAASGRNPAADAIQSFQANPASGAFSVADKRLRYTVVDVLLVSPLSAGQFPQPTLGCLGAALLQPSPTLLDLTATLFDIDAGMQPAVTVGGERHDAEVNAKPALGLELVSLGDIAGGGQHPLAADQAQIDLAFAEGHQASLVIAHHDGQHQATFQGPQADRSAVLDEAQNTIVVGLRRVGPKDRGNFSVDLEGVRHFGNRSHGRLSRQTESVPDLPVEHLVHVVLAPGVGAMAGIRKPRRRLIAARQRRPQAFSLIRRRQELHGGNQFHNVKYGALLTQSQARRAYARPAIPPLPEGRGFSRRTR